MSQSLNDSIANLPLPSLDQLADLALDQIAFQRADMADVELAVQMFGFMQKSSGKQFLSGFLIPFSVHILGTNRHLAGPGHRLAKFGNAEAAFRLSVFTFCMKDLWIRQH